MIKYKEKVIEYFKSKYNYFKNQSDTYFECFGGFVTFDFKEKTMYVEWIDKKELAEKGIFDDACRIVEEDFDTVDSLINLIVQELEF